MGISLETLALAKKYADEAIAASGASGGTAAQSVFNASTHYDFPSVGSANVIYKAETEKKIYQWNDTSLKYELLSENDIALTDIDYINGGNANGTA